MNIKAILSSFSIVFFAGLNTFAQNPTIIPTSPEASALAKMVNYPVNLNTGIPSISVPLYQIQDGNLTLPIGLSYHAGGFKINERSTSVGLGWSLNADLQITQTINGQSDFTPGNGYIANTLMRAYYDNAQDCPDCTFPFGGSYAYDYGIATGNGDPAPDKFSYKLLDKAGSFYFMKDNAGTSYTIVPVPYENIKIIYNDGQFIITDTDGTTYYFGTPGPRDAAPAAELGFEFSGNMPSGGICLDCVVTSYKCKKIENATKTNKFDFTYVAKPIETYTTSSEYIEYYNNPDPCAWYFWYFNPNQLTSIPDYQQLISTYPFLDIGSPKYMVVTPGASQFVMPYMISGTTNFTNRIFPNPGGGYRSQSQVAGIALSKVTFNGGSADFFGTDKLDSIKVKNTAGQEIKTFSLFHTYTPSSDMVVAKIYNGNNWKGTLYLDSIQIKSGNVNYEHYGFLYNNKFCFGDHLKGRDAWGFCNATTGNIDYSIQTTIPKQEIYQKYWASNNPVSGCLNYVMNTFTFGSNGSAENPNLSGSQNGMLTRIIYPTGGFATFAYEGNMYRETIGFTNARPVMMAGGLRIRSIDYYGVQNSYPVSQKYYRYGELEDGIGLQINTPPRNYNITSKQFDAYKYYQTIKYLSGPKGTPGGSPSFPPIPPPACLTQACLSLYTEEIKTTYRPAASFDYTYSSGAPIYYTKVTEYNSDMGTATGKKVYKFYSPTSFVFDITELYNIISTTNIPYLKTDGFTGAQKAIEDYKYVAEKYQLVHKKDFEYVKYEKTAKPRVVYSFLRNIYQIANGSFAGTPQGLYNTSSGSFAGNGDDYYSGQYGIRVGTLLLKKETENWYNNADVLTTINQYAYDNSLYLQPSRIITTNSDGRILTKTIKHAYDLTGVGIYQSMTTKNMIDQVIEEVVTDNSIPQEISRTKTNYDNISAGLGFVAPVSVQRSFKGNPLQTELTYDQYDQNGNLLQTTGRDELPTSYLWGYGYKYPIAELKGSAYSNIGLYVNVAALQSVTDEQQIRTTTNLLRTNLPDAMVTSFTYKPLIGISSQTAPNGLNKFYDYDGYGRLSYIKDKDQKILKKYDYLMTPNAAMFGQENYFSNIPVMGTFSIECSPGIFKTYNCTVPGAKFNATDANQAYNDAESYMFSSAGDAGFSIPCPSVAQGSAITLRADMFIGNPIPGNVFIDLIQNESVTASQKFPYTTGSRKFFVPAGQYTLGLRMNENYNLSIIEFYFQPSTGSGFFAKPGDNITIQDGLSYNITVTNSQIP